MPLYWALDTLLSGWADLVICRYTAIRIFRYKVLLFYCCSMIIKILSSASGFPGVNYNTNKIDKDKGELLKVANFGPLQGLTRLRPQDYVNYLQMVSKLNSRVRKPQFHAVLSAKGKSYDKHELSAIAEQWLKLMGYGSQPYLVVFHKDTDNNHVHIVTTRVGKDGVKINSAYEKIRALKCLDNVLGYPLAMQYQFSTRAQFYLILESFGLAGKDYDGQKLDEKIGQFRPDKYRAETIRKHLIGFQHDKDFPKPLKEKYGLELVFHAAPGKPPYGYTIIDHETKTVFKGSEIIPLRQLLDGPAVSVDEGMQTGERPEQTTQPIHIGPVRIAGDVDDEAVHGRRRRKKARTNKR
jgi:hypothetical protein